MKNTITRILALLLVTVMSLNLVACGTSDATHATDSNSLRTNNSLSETPSTSNIEITQLDKFQQFEKELSDKHIEFEVVQKMGSMVGAKEGYGYKFNDETSLELYLFDKNSDAYKEAVKTNKLYLESFGITMDVVFNNDICIYFNGEPANKAEIETIFKNLK